MNHRVPISCSTCKQGIVMRVGVGTQMIQHFAIQCPNCHQKISFDLLYDKNKRMATGVKNLFNCEFAKEADDFIAINLHAEMIYPKKYINEKTLMPSVFVTLQMREHAEKKGFFDEVKSSQKKGQLSVFGAKEQFVFDGIGGDSDLLEDWIIIKKAYSLHESNMVDIMHNELKKYSKFDEVHIRGPVLFSIIFDFLHRFLFPDLLLYYKLKKNFNDAKKKKKEFSEFKKFYNNELQSIHWKNYIDIFNEYFDSFSEFNRLLLNAKIDLHPEQDTEGVFCPANFDDVKMYYGNAYEYITTNLTTFACINNILYGRTYDTFQTMTLKKYMTELNKDSRLNPLKSDTSFQIFTDGINSTIRNASHHKWFYVNKSKPGFLEYRSGGTGAIHELSYLDYIYQSNMLMRKLAMMTMLEIKFLYKDK